jgi:hypothetical protein
MSGKYPLTFSGFVPLKTDAHCADTLNVDQELETAEPVALRAVREGRVLSWDTHPALAASLKSRLEADGWRVTITTGEGPRRRRLPRIDPASAEAPA